MKDSTPTGDQTDAATPPSAAGPVLVTGFGHFPGVDDNPSGRFARAVDGTTIDGVAVIGRVVPVEWRRAWPAIVEAVEAHRPAALLMYGVAVNRSQVEIERFAHNLTGASADAVGALPDSPRIVRDAPDRLDTTLPWEALLGPQVGLSEDAGDYLCNYVMYMSVYTLCNRVPFCGFVHVPAHDSPGAYAVLRRMVGQLR